MELETQEHPQEFLNGAPIKPERPNTYKLTSLEKETVQRALDLERSLKMRVYELQTQLEAIQRDLIGAAGQTRGNIMMLAQSRGWMDAVLSEDLTTLTRRQNGLDLPQ